MTTKKLIIYIISTCVDILFVFHTDTIIIYIWKDYNYLYFIKEIFFLKT